MICISEPSEVLPALHETGPLLDVFTATAVLGVSRQRVRQLVAQGKLDSVVILGRVYLRAGEVAGRQGGLVNWTSGQVAWGW